MLTDEDRKQSISHNCECFTFESCLDLSRGIKVIPLVKDKRYPLSWYSRDLASFICWWEHFIMKDLNGFSGFHNINFKIIDCEIYQD